MRQNEVKVIRDLEFLSKPCIEVPKDNRLWGKIADELHNAISNLPNTAGLAHNQIGGNHRAFVMAIEEKLVVFINPRITKRSPHLYSGIESCKSIDGMYIVERPSYVVVEADNLNVPLKASGRYSVCFCHELDHLNGVTIKDIGKKTTTNTPRKRTSRKVGRNESCSCGSGQKFKKCCGR
ncbi:MAG: hypothetical protein GY861_20780 [bacterium]|nr:hypothetical protein [bacterium]